MDAAALQHRLTLAEGLLLTLRSARPSQTSVSNAKALLEGDGRLRLSLVRGGPADPKDLKATRKALAAEIGRLQEVLPSGDGPVRSHPAPKPAKPDAPHPKARGRTGKAHHPAPAQSGNQGFEEQHPRGRGGEWIKKGEGYGDEGPSPAVSQLQERLRELGFRVQQDGQFGPITEQAVKAFQERYGLSPSGEIDAATTTLMRNPPAETLAQTQKDNKEMGVTGKAAGDKPKDKNSNRQGETSQRRSDRLHQTDRQQATTQADSKAQKLRRPEAKGGANLGDKTLHKGAGMGEDADHTVRKLQQVLLDLGYDLGDAGVDGRLGPDTEKAIRKLQHKYGLREDGAVGKDTKALLTRLAARHAKARPTAKIKATVPKQISESTIFNPSLHPRGRGGKWTEVLKGIQAMGSGSSYRVGSMRVTRKPNDHYQVSHSGGSTTVQGASGAVAMMKRHSGGTLPRHGPQQPTAKSEPLLERPGSYFNLRGMEDKYGVKPTLVPLADVQPTRGRPEGIANAEPLMAKAAYGSGSKRDPIVLVRDGKGQHKVFDGNSTYAIAKKHGWKSIPALVVDSEDKARGLVRKYKTS